MKIIRFILFFVLAGQCLYASEYRTVKWDNLIPADWDMEKEFGKLNIQNMEDGDPIAMMRLQKFMDKAPADPSLDGVAIKIAGYIAPLDYEGKNLKEFLLVPYFGACIHSPPPPANQIIYVVADKNIDRKFIEDAVYVSGVLKVKGKKTGIGATGYSMKLDKIEMYF
jgi:hypothetical protein